MKLYKATFEQIYSTGHPYLNQRLGGEILLEEGETLEDAWVKLKREADAMHRKFTPGLYIENTMTGEITRASDSFFPPEPITVDRTIGVTVADIESCESIAMLQTYKFIVKGKPELIQAYDSKMKELTA